jgi:uncharacterized protein YkwD
VGKLATAALIVTLANAARAQHHLPALRVDPRLVSAAQVCREEDDPGRCIRRFYPAALVGENTAWGCVGARTVIAAWLSSPGHRANILGHFSATGAAELPDCVYVQVFAR